MALTWAEHEDKCWRGVKLMTTEAYSTINDADFCQGLLYGTKTFNNITLICYSRSTGNGPRYYSDTLSPLSLFPGILVNIIIM